MFIHICLHQESHTKENSNTPIVQVYIPLWKASIRAHMILSQASTPLGSSFYAQLPSLCIHLFFASSLCHNSQSHSFKVLVIPFC